MYKDDNMISGGCNEALLRMMLGGSGRENSSCQRKDSQGNGCSCEGNNDRSWGLAGYPLASVFAPLQNFDNLYDAETALKQGTLFAELDLPFSGTRIQKGGNCRG